MSDSILTAAVFGTLVPSWLLVSKFWTRMALGDSHVRTLDFVMSSAHIGSIR